VLENGLFVVVSLLVAVVVVCTLLVVEEARVDTVVVEVDVGGNGRVSVGSQLGQS
jgi:hypothetical protein